MNVVCDIIDCEEKIKEWISSDSKVLKCGFKDNMGNTTILGSKYYQYGKYKLNFIEVIEEIQMNIQSDIYPSNVLLSFKNQKENPKDDSLPKWSDKSIEEWRYWYLIGIKM